MASPPDNPTRPWWRRAQAAAWAVPHLVRDEIWRLGHVQDHGPRAWFFGFLRVIALTLDGLRDNRIPSQAAALSYSTLIALGPLIAIAIMVSGFIMPEDGRDRIADALTDAVYFVAPSAEKARTHEALSNGQAAPLGQAEAETRQAETSDIENVIDHLVASARSGTFGVIGSLILIGISVQLLSTIEKTFNTIWGVRKGRNFIQQLVFYWTFISLGAVLGVTAVTLGVYSKIAHAFDNIPYGHLFRDSLSALTPLFVFAIVVTLLGAFYRFIPNARVRWLPALLGSTAAALLLYANQALSFLYIGFVIRQQSLFGAVGIIPVLLLGLLIFWGIVLLGGQLTYAIQNADRLTHQRAWEDSSRRAQEMLALAAMALVARRFERCESPLSAEEIGERIRAPGNLVNHTLGQLADLGLVSAVGPLGNDESVRYQPGRPLDRLSLAEFKEALDLDGNNEALPMLEEADPLARYYRKLLLEIPPGHPATAPLRDALAEDKPD